MCTILLVHRFTGGGCQKGTYCTENSSYSLQDWKLLLWIKNMITDFWFWYLSLSAPLYRSCFQQSPIGTFAWCMQCVRMIVDSKERIIKIYLSLIKYFLFNHVHVLCVSVKTFVFYYMVIYLSISGILCKLYLQIFFDISKQIQICIFSFKNIYTF